jgi:hypothetical protein
MESGICQIESGIYQNGKWYIPKWKVAYRMKVLHFNVLTSCPKDELHQWFIGLYGEQIIPAIVHRYTQGITQGSHVYEINAWLWNFGRPHPRVDGLSVAKTERIRRKSRSEAARRA